MEKAKLIASYRPHQFVGDATVLSTVELEDIRVSLATSTDLK